MKTDTILRELALECRNGATDANSAYEHLIRVGMMEPIGDEYLKILALLHIINFSALRERAEYFV
mgnify:CR=1 FL=1